MKDPKKILSDIKQVIKNKYPDAQIFLYGSRAKIMNGINSNDYSANPLKRTKETIPEVEKHIENEFWNTAINRMYYACFYAVGALLISRNIEVSSHSGIPTSIWSTPY